LQGTWETLTPDTQTEGLRYIVSWVI